MEKDKIIEEMKQTLVDYALKNDLCFSFDVLHNHAKVLVNAGYRKIPEGSVVLSKEEYVENLYRQFKDGYKQARKATAKVILQEFKRWAREYYYKDTVIDENGERPMTSNEKLNYLYTYLLDKFGVEE